MQDTSFLNILHIAEFPEYRINSEYRVDKINSEKMPPPKKKKLLNCQSKRKRSLWWRLKLFQDSVLVY